uniref:Putative ovule protein n=1 Tax=Solanum chacoense TaxID=4108 RepID=A0A0V0HDW7_SOLCH
MLCNVFLLFAMASSLSILCIQNCFGMLSLLYFLSFPFLYLSRGSIETTSLPSQGRGKVCVHTALPRPHS